jgi:predicted kinase
MKIFKSFQPWVVFLIGVPGSGKSTWITNNFVKLNNPNILSTDNLLEEFANSLGITYNEAWNIASFQKLEEKMYENLENSIINKNNIVVDRTNISIKSRLKILEKIILKKD